MVSELSVCFCLGVRLSMAVSRERSPKVSDGASVFGEPMLCLWSTEALPEKTLMGIYTHTYTHTHTHPNRCITHTDTPMHHTDIHWKCMCGCMYSYRLSVCVVMCGCVYSCRLSVCVVMCGCVYSYRLGVCEGECGECGICV